jgi:hypothetical protein
MEIYMINTGNKYAIYYNPPKETPKAESEEKSYAWLGRGIENLGGARAGLTTREFRISSDLEESINEAYSEFAESSKNKMQKLSNKIRTRTSAILKDAAHSDSAILNYSNEISESSARKYFLRIVRKEKIKSWAILGACALAYLASWNPLTMPVPTIWLFGPAMLYQMAVIKTLGKGIKNISFSQSTEVAKLERIIAGERGIGLDRQDLIDYRAAKGL